MDQIEVVGGSPLKGSIAISGAKNAALPLMVASLLSPEPLILQNVPRLADITHLKTILAQHGIGISEKDEGISGVEIALDGADITSTTAPYDLVRKMRASFWVLGPLLTRFGEAKVSLPGGCAIGTRPVDLHLMGLEAMGAEIELEEGYVLARAPKGLKGAEIRFPFVSVGATINVMLAAVLAGGTTVMHNAASEPEVGDLAACLTAMGAKISGVGSRSIEVTGVGRLAGATHRVLPDRIETGTFAMAAVLAGGHVELTGTDPNLISSVLPVLREVGAEVSGTEDTLSVSRAPDSPIHAVDITTEPFPGFPTDLQAQFMALMTLSDGRSHIHETIFENRFMHVPELMRMGAQIEIDGDSATVTGVPALRGAPVMATDLRASVSLVIAGLAAQGRTTIARVYHLDRGFQRLEEKLLACGADIRRVNG